MHALVRACVRACVVGGMPRVLGKGDEPGALMWYRGSVCRHPAEEHDRSPGVRATPDLSKQSLKTSLDKINPLRKNRS